MNDVAPAARDFLAARDLLLRYRTDYDRAYREFRWPELDTFNWALDYFDVIARGNDQPALWIVDDPRARGCGCRTRRCRSARRGWRTSCAAWASCAATGCC